MNAKFVSQRFQVEVGEQYQATRAAYGMTPTVWQVISIYEPWPGGMEHARLESVDGRFETMTLAVAAVADKTRFIRVL